MVKTLQLDLGTINSFAPPALAPGQATGWYVNQITGQWYYYYAPTGQWYVYAAGVFFPLAVGPLGLPSWRNSPSPKVSVAHGDTLRLELSFRYIGSEAKGVYSLYSAIIPNVQGAVIDEWQGFSTGYIAFDVPYSAAGMDIQKTIDFELPLASWLESMGYLSHGGQDGAIYFMVHKDPLHRWYSPGYLNAIYLAKPVGEFQELKITSIAKK